MQQSDQYIKDNYLQLSSRAMARQLGCSKTYVLNRMRKLGLVLPDHIKLQRKLSQQFKPGHTPHSKGKPAKEWMRPDQYNKWTSQQFKKGNLPHNTLHDNKIVLRRDSVTGAVYKYIRISVANWDLLQRHVYRTQVGELLDHEVINFKNGDTLDCSPDNLYKITRAQHMLNNSIHKHGPEVAAAHRMIAKINRRLTKKQKQ